MENKYTVESDSNTKLIYIGLGLIMLNILLMFSDIKIPSHFYFRYYSLGELLVESILFIIRIVCVVLAVKTSVRLGRPGFFWGLFTLIFTPIALIILGTKGVKLDGEKRKVYKEIRAEYFINATALKRNFETGISAKDEYQAELDKLEEEYDEYLNKEMHKIEEQESQEKINELIERVKGAGEVMEIGDRCPACGADLTLDSKECPDCGLSFE